MLASAWSGLEGLVHDEVNTCGSGDRSAHETVTLIVTTDGRRVDTRTCVWTDRDDDGRILLARRAREPDKGRWDLPGGFLDEGEDPRDALRRELTEETSLDVELLEFFDVVVDRYGAADDAQWTLNLYWTCRVVSGTPTPADDVDELRWFARDELPPAGELAFHNNVKVISRWRDEHS